MSVNKYLAVVNYEKVTRSLFFCRILFMIPNLHCEVGGSSTRKPENTHADSCELSLHGAHHDKHAAGPEKYLPSSEEKIALRTLSTKTQPIDWNKFSFKYFRLF